MTFFTHPDEALDTLDDVTAVAATRPLAGDHAQDLYDTYLGTRPDVSHARRLAAIMTDRYRVASIRLAERKAAAGAAPVWMYRFDFETDVEDGALGAPHAMDIAYTFGNPDASALSGSRPERYAVADTMSGVWSAFAGNGAPHTADLPTWGPYDDQLRTTMLFDVASRAVTDPDADERTAWNTIPIAL